MKSENDHVDGNIKFDNLPDDAYLRSRSIVKNLVPFSMPTLWRRVKDGSFPPAIKISEGITAWRMGDIREWLKDPNTYRVGGRK